MEAELVPQHGYPVAPVQFSGLRGRNAAQAIITSKSSLALCQSAAVLLRHRPDVVLGMGGYLTFLAESWLF